MLVAGVVVAFAALMQMATGMGFGMIAAPLLVLADPVFAPAPILIMGLAVASAGAFRERRHLVNSELIGGLGGRVIGMGFAVFLITLLPGQNAYMIVFGSIILVAVLLAASGWKVPFNQPNLWSLSIVSGLMGTITSVGAPPMALLYQGQAPSKIRPTLNAFFFFGSVVGLVGLFTADLLTPAHPLVAALLFVPMLAGMWLSRWFSTDDPKRLSVVLLALSGGAAALLVFRGIFGV